MSKKVQTLQKIVLINAPRVCVVSNDEREVRGRFGMHGWMDAEGHNQRRTRSVV